MSLLSQFSFKGRQEQAATDPNPAIAVTAGAGSGKTLSLVGRYLHLLEQGYPLRSILAITFTEKAAREMRSRIREVLSCLPDELEGEEKAKLTAKPAKLALSGAEVNAKENSNLSGLSGSKNQSQDSPLPLGEGPGVRSGVDSARIGTIHSLCAEILRAHPAEAGLDPAFSVLEEGLAAALQAEAIESALAWAATDQRSVALFGVFKENDLREILKTLLSRRLDISSDEDHSQYTDYTDFTDIHGKNLTEIRVHPRNPACPDGFAGSNPCTEFASVLASHLATHLDSPSWTGSLSDLTSRRSTTPDDKLELARQSVLARWDEIQQARAAQDWDAVLSGLASLRKAIDTRGGRKDAWDAVNLESVRQDMTDLKDIYDEHLKFLAEKSRWALDEQAAAHLPALRRLFDQTLREYQRRKDERQSLDFDDLEGLTAQLLSEHPDVRARWQSELRAVLVDEFQDTNERQRQIVYALTNFSPLPKLGEGPGVRADSPPPVGEVPGVRADSPPPVGEGPGVGSGADLFIVGDAKQSIYKFRNADVTVFRQVQTDVQTSGGISLNLDLTFRAHRALLEGLNALLAPILGETDDPARPYAVPFAPLRAYRQAPVRENIQPPYIEFHLGLGQDAEEGRAIAASALAHRLRQLRETEGFAWGEMALLFRSSTAYAAYETALEQAGIPFVTVAGRGFYDRPEIRDLLNALAAIADLTDDLALAGLLRSPAFALPDAAIYRLRFNLAPEQSNREARQEREGDLNLSVLRGLSGSSLLSFLFASAEPPHQRAHAILNELHALAGRAPAATVLKRFLDLTGYRAVLSAAPAKYSKSEGARMTRNVDKLLADAHRSRLVNLREFLAYVQTLRDVGLREGEAPADPSTGSGGAVQLMTVHKAKGLEFPLVVIADAAYEHRGSAGKILLHPDLGLLLDLKDDDFHPTAWQLATRLESDRDDAEDCRLLYVAATRAKEKLLISGHVKLKKSGSLDLNGWLGRLGGVVGLDEISVDMSQPEPLPLNVAGISGTLYPVSADDSPLSLGEEPGVRSDSPQPASVSLADSPLPLGEGPGVRSDLLEPLIPAALPVTDEKSRAREIDPPQRVWRVVSTTKRPRVPAWLVGRLVHEALRRWRFPGDGFEDFLRPFALEAGLTEPAEIHAAIQEARRLLERFRAHPIFAEMDAAERHHEIPYYLPGDRGVIDLLYRTPAGWFIADFKTDEVRSDAEPLEAIRQNGYDRQVARYAEAVVAQLGIRPKTMLVFLQVGTEVKIYA